MGEKRGRALFVMLAAVLACGIASPASASFNTSAALAPRLLPTAPQPLDAVPPAVPSPFAASVAAPSLHPGTRVFWPRTPPGPCPNFGARYYGSKIGRFTTTDPVYTWQENILDPQRWNRYAYARNNPLRYVDPDGKEIALAANLSKGEAKFIVNALTQIAARPSGREALTALINDPNRIVLGVGSVNDPANVDAARKGETVGLTFGTTTFLDPTTNEVSVTIDRQALGEFSSRTRPSLDRQGVTSTAHEIYHARDALSGKPQQFLAGDRPTSATGPAEGFGQSVRREKRDISKDAARQIVTGALEKKE